MITSLEVNEYRGFEQYRLGGLARVNLLVGKNNSGKTALLEAVQLLCSGGDPIVFAYTAFQRGEVTTYPEQRERPYRPPFADISHYFHGHQFGPGSQFSLTATPHSAVRVDVTADADQAKLFDSDDNESATALMVRIDSKGPFANGHQDRVLPASLEGAVSIDTSQRSPRRAILERATATPIQFIAPESLEPRFLLELWDQVLYEGREPEVVDAMRIIEPRLSNIFFLSSEHAYRYAGQSGILAAFEGEKRRVPLGSCGDGMRRLLALSLCLIRSGSGFLLADEIDTGLHYSIMGDMWHLVVRAAMESDVQVFATTHSYDCFRGLSWLCESFPELRSEVCVHKIEPELTESVRIDADQIMIAVDQGIEVR